MTKEKSNNLKEAQEGFTTFLNLECGVLLKEDDPEFKDYSVAYDHKHGYYDETYLNGLEEDFESLKEGGLDYVKDGVNGTYAILTKIDVQGTKEDDFIQHAIKEIEEQAFIDESIDFLDGEQFKASNIIWSAYKNDNGEIIENFVDTNVTEECKNQIKESSKEGFKPIKLKTEDGKEIFIVDDYGSGYQVATFDGFGNFNPWQKMETENKIIDGEEYSFVIGYDTYNFDTVEEAIKFAEEKYGKLERISESIKEEYNGWATAIKLVNMARKDGHKLKYKDAKELLDQSYNGKGSLEDFYSQLTFDEYDEELEAGDCAYHPERDEYYYLKKTDKPNKFELFTYSDSRGFEVATPRFIEKNSPFYNKLKLHAKNANPELKESCNDKEIINTLVANGSCVDEKEASERVARMSKEEKDNLCKAFKAQAQSNLLNDSLKEEYKEDDLIDLGEDEVPMTFGELVEIMKNRLSREDTLIENLEEVAIKYAKDFIKENNGTKIIKEAKR